MGGPGSGGWRYSGERIKRVDITCAQCGVVFQRLPSRFRCMRGRPGYCSKACQNASMRKEQLKRYPHKCAQCRIDFLVTDKKRKYCSRACQAKAFSVEFSARGIEARRRVCTLCGKDFLRNPRTNNNGLVCSRDCYFRHCRETTAHKRRVNQLIKIYSIKAKFCRIALLTRHCVVCGSGYVPSTPNQRFCSRACIKGNGRFYKPYARQPRTCVDCGATFMTTRATAVRCPKHMKKLSKRRQRQKEKKTYGRQRRHEDRARRRGLPRDYSIKPFKVFARDGWRCRLCGRRTPKRLNGKQQPLSPTIDHIVPISQGGGHTWDNVQLACHECNMKKGAKTLGQLRLSIYEIAKAGRQAC